MSAGQVIYTRWLREMKWYVRGKARIIQSIAQPFLWLAIIGVELSSSFSLQGGVSYLQFMAPGIVALGRKAAPFAEWCIGDGGELPFATRCADLLLACEVLEHVPEPEAVLGEMRRLARRYCLVSVPNEPLWRCLNVARGRYVRRWGNTPGHLQHWSRRGIVSLVRRYADPQVVIGVLPWTFVLAAVR